MRRQPSRRGRARQRHVRSGVGRELSARDDSRELHCERRHGAAGDVHLQHDAQGAGDHGEEIRDRGRQLHRGRERPSADVSGYPKRVSHEASGRLRCVLSQPGDLGHQSGQERRHRRGHSREDERLPACRPAGCGLDPHRVQQPADWLLQDRRRSESALQRLHQERRYRRARLHPQDQGIAGPERLHLRQHLDAVGPLVPPTNDRRLRSDAITQTNERIKQAAAAAARSSSILIRCFSATKPSTSTTMDCTRAPPDRR